MTPWRLCLAVGSTALAAACYGPNAVTAPDDILLLTASPESVPADGFSTSRIVATVNPRVDRALVITFESSAGATIPGTSFAPDSNGQVTTFVRSGTVPGSVLVTAKVTRGGQVEASRSVAVTLTPATAGSVIRLSLSTSQLEADGASSLQVRADVNQGVANRTVKFEATNGSFAPGTVTTRTLADVPINADGIARALLYAPTEIGTGLVTVTSNGFSASDTVTFVRAMPDSISVTATPLSLLASETAVSKIVATLSRALGKVTDGTRVDFSIAHDDTGQSFGRFSGVTRSNGSQQASADFVPGAAAPPGLATVTARVPGTNLTAEIKILITP